jgi:tetratricopeptide (TPR) repeat protein
MLSQTTSEGQGPRLNSWKEIAAYFGKDERTVKRWEVARGLPVRRVPGGTRTSVFAYAGELDAWLSAPRTSASSLEAETDTTETPTIPSATRPGWRILAAATVVAVLGVAGLSYLGTRVSPAQTSAAPAAPAEVQALYDAGVVAWSSRTADGFHRAIENFEAALEIAPDFAPAHAGLANVYNLISQYTSAPAAESYARGRAEAEKAIELDPNSAEAYAALGFNAFYGSREFQRAFDMFEKSLSLAPDRAQTLHWYALTSMQTGKFERPRQLIDRAIAINPEARSIRANAALIHYYSGDTETAIATLEQMRQVNPDYLAVPSYLATMYLDQHRYAEFLDNYETAARIEGRVGRLLVAKAARDALPQGGAAMLEAMLTEQLRQFEAGDELAYKVAATANLLGQTDLALEYLTTSVERRETLGLLVEPEFRTLRGNPRFEALVEKLGLPD